MRALSVLVLGLVSTPAWADGPMSETFANANVLPPAFKIISALAVGPAQLMVMSDGQCTCNNVPPMQRHLGQPEPDCVNWACEAPDVDSKKAN